MRWACPSLPTAGESGVFVKQLSCKKSLVALACSHLSRCMYANFDDAQIDTLLCPETGPSGVDFMFNIVEEVTK